ncbi:hypothetical protein BLA24_19895 [Streptomyces cinnamoneus]|uniref:LPXTG cell wall anchor domain-containing protein n=1 Tax=Streptomyces cinnamoneus TaxID=53446 RepID=A0A2G1XF82_STRCJ|nr:hypothetical protein [Streptomyces cinnamoneus]PHQ49898.1 hypothetical protein BLA24_19895 [Streptomyces cinnamoneus]PPT13326.1 hypothetical protein CYQ11_10895 [Streptomyces cinnamoneus]
MASVRFALCGAVAAVAAAAAPVHAHAHDGPATGARAIELAPVAGRPGGEVKLHVSGCAGDRATAVSKAFVSDARLARDPAGLYAEATVRDTVPAGSYPVRVDCDGHSATAHGRLTVVDKASLDDRARDLPGPGPAEDDEPPDGRGYDDASHDESGPGGAYREEPGPGAYDERSDRAPQHHPHGSPFAPVPAGGGGTRPAAAPEAPDTAGLVLAGVTAAIAGALIWHRRRTGSAQR